MARSLSEIFTHLGPCEGSKCDDWLLSQSHNFIIDERRSHSIVIVQPRWTDLIVLVQGRNMYVKIGDKDVEYHKNFRLVLHTKLSNPHYPPEIQVMLKVMTHL